MRGEGGEKRKAEMECDFWMKLDLDWRRNENTIQKIRSIMHGKRAEENRVYEDAGISLVSLVNLGKDINVTTDVLENIYVTLPSPFYGTHVFVY